MRLDAIGDYVLFRNFLEKVRHSRHFEGYRIFLCGNEIWRDLAECLDSSYIDGFIWVNRQKFRTSPLYKFRIIDKIRSYCSDTCVHPVHSRDFFWADQIVRYSGALKRIAPYGDTINITESQKTISDGYYTNLISEGPPMAFEFDRNREFFSGLLSENLNIRAPKIPFERTELKSSWPNYCVLFPGASQPEKCWDPKNFSKVAQFVGQKCGIPIVICGSASDKDKAAIILADLERGKALDLTGKTDLKALTDILAGARLILTNDTAALHIAAATQNPNIICIANGNHYGRFIPYPQNSFQVKALFPPELERITDEGERKKMFYFGAHFNVNTIKVETVIRAVALQF